MNRGMGNSKKEFLYHMALPLLLGLYSLLFLLVKNIHCIFISSVFAPLGVILALCFLVYLIVFLCLKNYPKASLVSSLILFVLLFYGHIQMFFMKQGILFTWAWSRPVLLALISCMVLVPAVMIVRNRGDLKKLYTGSLLVVLALNIMPLWSLGMYGVREHPRIAAGLDHIRHIDPAVTPGSPGQMPDIYYIIADGYGRSDVLREMYSCDNSGFIRW
ncbi:MAG TPA: hypothetical protein PLT75_18515, partial [Spirochaetota bacterium]|nr:hypothetical protein [Spirochaetota bacterium]